MKYNDSESWKHLNHKSKEETLTNRFSIHYSKKNGTHIVSAKPKNKGEYKGNTKRYGERRQY